jgi:hypothetical protein
MRLNTDDQALCIRAKTARWFPLLCAIRYGACDLGYHVLSDRKVKIVYLADSKPWRGFPYANYPLKLGPRPIAYTRIPFRPDRPMDLIKTLGVFGCDGLSAGQMASLIKFADPDGSFDPTLTPYKSLKDLLCNGLAWPLIQGRPTEGCPETSCRNYERKNSLKVFSIFEEDSWDAVRKLWGPHCDNLQIIHQYCPECGAIRATNQCT